MYHIVRITTRGYKLNTTFAADTVRAAAEKAIASTVRSYPTVLRDGLIGKRYSIEQCERIVREVRK